MPKKQHSKKHKSAVARCIFWGPNNVHGSLTSEHIFGKWLKNYTRSDLNKHRMRETQIGRPGTLHVVKTSDRAGDPVRSAAKIVCGECNSGWLSRIQDCAKPFLTPLIQGRTTVLDAAAQRAIAAWCTMATMTGEYLSRESDAIAITQNERDWFRDRGTAPINWKIWIGRQGGNTGRWNHYVVPLSDSKNITSPPNEALAAPNTQTTTIGIGKLLVHVLSSTGVPDTVARWVWPANTRIGLLLPQIFPAKESVIVWPSNELTNGEAEFVADAFERCNTLAGRANPSRLLF